MKISFGTYLSLIAFLVSLFALILVLNSYSMKRIPAVTTSIARLADTFTDQQDVPQYEELATPLWRIKDYFERLFWRIHETHDHTIEFLTEMRRIRALIIKAPTTRKGYVSAIKRLEDINS